MKRPDNRPRKQATTAACFLSAVCLAATGIPASAQQLPVSESTRTFDAAYFAQFNPVSAEDMVRRVPGFAIDDGDVRRGFAGSAGNVLINGERPSSKTPISEQLSRLSARDVLRIDLYAGGAEGAGASGQTLYVDVRLRPREAAATNTFVAQASVLDPSQSVNPLLVLSSAFRAGDATVNLALQAQPARRGRIEYDKYLFTPAGAVTEQGPEFLQGDYWEYKVSGRAAWKPTDADTLSLNAQITPSKDGRHTFSEVYTAGGDLLRTEDSKVVGDDTLTVEFGGDWDRRLSDTASFKLIGLASGKSTGSSERYSRTPVSGAFVDTFIERASEAGEYIGRGVFAWQPDALHAVEFGGEAAFNFLDSQLTTTRVTPLGSTDIATPGANTRVEEQRAELYMSDVWQATQRLKIESRLTMEASKITQTGDSQKDRDFTFLKPRINATWNASDAGQFRILAERDVSQLDFTEFAASRSDFDSVVTVGNPNLEPERAWRIQGEWERRFGSKGALVVSLFHEEVEAVRDQIRVTVPGPPIQSFDSAGNLGDGQRTGIRIDATAPLDAVGLAGAELRFKGKLQETRVTDPTTQTERAFSDETDWDYSVDLRHPLPDLKLVWGALYEDAGATQTFRFAELRSLKWDGPHIDLFVETTAIPGLVVRLTAADITLPNEVREIGRYSPDRADPANLSSLERRYARGGYGTRSYAVRIAGRF